MLSSKRRSRDDFDQIMKHRDYVTGRTMQVEYWNSMKVSPDVQFLQNITKIKSAV